MTQDRVLITGIHGFTGHYMANEMLAAGYRVFGTGTESSKEKDYFQANLNDKSSLESILKEIQPNYVIHLAALSFVGYPRPEEFYQVNLIGTRHLLEALSRQAIKPEKILLASSANIYGNQSIGALNEACQPSPQNDYAISKLAMEHMAGLWSDKLPILITRPFNYTGVMQSEDFVLPKIISHFKMKLKTIELGNLEIWREFNDVRSLADIYRRLIETKEHPKIVNVGSGITHQLSEVLTLCQELTGHHIEVKINQKFVRENEVKTLCSDPSLLKAVIGSWKNYTLKDTLEWMLQAP